MPDTYFDLANRHEVYLHRLATGLVNDYTTPNLQSAYKAARLILLDAETITSNTQLNKITSAVTAAIKPEAEVMWSGVTNELINMAAFEAAYQAKLFKDVYAVNLDIPATEKITKYIDSSLMTLQSGQRVNSGVWAEYTAQNTSSLVNTYKNQIRAGYSDSETVSQIVKRLRNVTNGMLRNEAEALARTGMSHYSINAREAMMRDNESVITGRYFNSVFDNRRTLICSSYAAKQDNRKQPWGVNDPTAPILPLHFSERSNWLFLVNNQKRPEGTRAAVGGKQGEEAEERFERRENALNKRRDNPNIEGETSSKVKYRGRRDSDTFDAGQISGDTKVSAWLRSQPDWFIFSNLGKKRGQMFINGELSLEKLTDFTGKPLTLKQLKDSET